MKLFISVFDLVHDQSCGSEIPVARTNKLDSSHDYAVPEPPLSTSEGGVRDAIIYQFESVSSVCVN